MAEQGQEYQYILVDREIDPHIARITFNRPDKLNAMNPAMNAEIAAAMDELEWDDSVKVIVLRGAGRAFSTGADLGEFGKQYGWEGQKPGEKPGRVSLRARLKADRRGSQFFQRFFFCSKALICQIQGYAVGGGFDIFLACDLSILSEDAKLGHPGMLFGSPFYDISQILWHHKLGMTLMKDLCLTGRMLSAQEAKEWRIVNHVVPMDELEAKTAEVARQVARISADGIVVGKTHLGMLYNTMNIQAGYNYSWIGHTLGTNMKLDPDEFNFLKERRDKGASAAFRERDKHFSGQSGS